jgi:hypothetical protein
MRALFVVAGVLFVFLILVSSGTVSGQLCVKNLGCLHSTGNGFSLDNTTSTVTTP